MVIYRLFVPLLFLFRSDEVKPSPCGVTDTMPTKTLHLSVESPRHLCRKAFRVAVGFSLLEVMIVLAIALILGAIAIPNFLTAYYDMRLKSACNREWNGGSAYPHRVV